MLNHYLTETLQFQSVMSVEYWDPLHLVHHQQPDQQVHLVYTAASSTKRHPTVTFFSNCDNTHLISMSKDEQVISSHSQYKKWHHLGDNQSDLDSKITEQSNRSSH